MKIGCKFYIYRLRSTSWHRTANALPKLGVEAYSTLGQFDFICKHFEGKDTFPTLLSRNGVQYLDLRPWRVRHIDRYCFQSNFEHAPLIAKGKKTLQNLNRAQETWKRLPDGVKQDLIDSNYILEAPFQISRYLTREIYKLFVFVSFPIATGTSVKTRSGQLRSILFPELASVVSGIYWDSEHEGPQCLLECEGADLRTLLDMVTETIHGHFQEGIHTETYFCIAPLFSTIRVDLLTSPFFSDAGLLASHPVPLEKYIGYFLPDYEKVEAIVERYEPDCYLGREHQDPTVALECIVLYRRFREDYDTIRNYKEEQLLPLAIDAQKAMAAMLGGLFTNDTKHILDGSMILGPWIEKLLRKTLEAVAYSHLSDAKLVKDVLKVPTKRPGCFDKLSAFEIEEKILLWNRRYPECPIVEGKLLAQWKNFRDLRNVAAHGRDAESHSAKEFAPLGFTIIAELLRKRDELSKHRPFTSD